MLLLPRKEHKQKSPQSPGSIPGDFVSVCDPSLRLQQSLGPPGPKSKKKVDLQKSPRKSPKCLKIPIFGPFWVVLDIFGYVSGESSADPTKDPF